MAFFAELRRRRVTRVAVAYLAVAWMLIEASATIFPLLHLPDWAVTLVLGLLTIGFPIAVVLAWFLDLSSGELRIDTSGAPGKEKSHPLMLALLTFAFMLVFAIGGLYLSWPAPAGWLLGSMGLDGSAVDVSLPDKPSLAILPFENRSADIEQGYFADAFTEELISNLSKIPQLFVISSHSSFAYRDKKINVEQVSKELGVQYVLMGSVRAVGDKVRITVQLTDALSGIVLWSEKYDRDLSELLIVQEEVIEKIVPSITSEVQAREIARYAKVSTDNLTAYAFFLRGLNSFRGDLRDAEVGRQLLIRATELDPNYADAFAMLALTYTMEMGMTARINTESLAKAEEAASRAIELDENSAVGYVGLAGIRVIEQNKEQALEFAQRAAELSPNALGSQDVLAGALLVNGQFLPALKALERGLRLDPRQRYVSYPFILGIINYQLGRTETGVALWERARKMSARYVTPRLYLVEHYQRTGQYPQARKVVAEILVADPTYTTVVARQFMQQSLGNIDEEIKLLTAAGLPSS